MSRYSKAHCAIVRLREVGFCILLQLLALQPLTAHSAMVDREIQRKLQLSLANSPVLLFGWTHVNSNDLIPLWLDSNIQELKSNGFTLDLEHAAWFLGSERYMPSLYLSRKYWDFIAHAEKMGVDVVPIDHPLSGHQLRRFAFSDDVWQETREEYMANAISEQIRSGKKVFYLVGGDHLKGLKAKLSARGIPYAAIDTDLDKNGNVTIDGALLHDVEVGKMAELMPSPTCSRILNGDSFSK